MESTTHADESRPQFPASAGGRVVWAWWPAVAMMAAIYVISGTPNLRAIPGGMSDHTGHFIGYALLGTLLVRALGGAHWRGVTASRLVAAWVIAAAYGMTDEFHQRFVPGRTAAVDDWVADALGAAAALAVVGVAAIGRRLENRKV